MFRGLPACLITIFFCTCLSAQQFEVGQTVVAISDAPMQTSDGSSGSIFPGLPVTIQQIRQSEADEAGQVRTELLIYNQRAGWIDASVMRTLEAAIKHFQELIDKEPDNANWKSALAMTMAASGDYQGAIDAFTTLLESDPDSVHYLNERAGALISLGEYSRAAGDFDRIIANHPEGVFFGNRAICKRALKDHEGARADFRQAIALEPDFPHLYKGLADVELAVGDTDAALKALDDFTARLPQVADGFAAKADIYVGLNNYEKALENYRSAASLEPENLDRQKNIGLLLKALGRTEEAIATFTKMIEGFPQNPDGLINRGVTYEENLKPQLALNDFDEALKLWPDSSFLFYHKGCVEIDLGDFEGAVADLSKAIEIEPKTIAFVRRGEAYSNMEKHQLAIDDFSKAIADDPSQNFARYRRAATYQILGELEKALADYTKLVDGGVQSWEVFHNRSNILELQKNHEAALADMEKAAELAPDNLSIINSLAWDLATYTDESLRSPQRAIELATRACEMSEWKMGLIIDTLAAAYAAGGDFDKAIELGEKALQQDDAKGHEELKAHLELFRAGKPVVR